MKISLPYLTNFVGAALMVLIIMSNRMNVKARKLEYIFLESMAVIVLLGNLAEALSDFLDGTSSKLFSPGFIYLINEVTFLCSMGFALLWICFVDYYMHNDLKRLKKIYSILSAPGLLCMLLIITDAAHNLIFLIDNNNVYSRQVLFYPVTLLEFAYLLYSIFLVYHSKKAVGMYVYFPVLLYLAPIFIGAICQALFYGIYLAWVFTALAVVGMFISLQHSMAFMDNLTGLYNKNYLNFVLQSFRYDKSRVYGGIMLDLDDFKSINDTYGHMVGDSAISNAGHIIKISVGLTDIAIRYAGDEFVILVKDANQKKLDRIMERVEKNAQTFNSNPNQVYKLHFSMGASLLYTEETNTDRFLHEMDTKMYEAKKRRKREQKESGLNSL